MKEFQSTIFDLKLFKIKNIKNFMSFELSQFSKALENIAYIFLFLR